MNLLNFLACKTCLFSTKPTEINNESNNKTCQNRKAHFRQFLSILGGCILMIDTGGHISWTSSALPYLTSKTSKIYITFDQSAWLASVDSICTIFGIITYPFVMDSIGRKYTILIFGSIQILAWILINFATSFTYLFLSRVIVGIGYGGTHSFFTIYIAEITEKSIRGMFLSVDKMCVNLGGFILNSVGAFVSYEVMNLVMVSIPIMALGALPFMHETPYFYLLKKRDEDAVKSLMKLHGQTSPEMVMEDIERMKKMIEECENSKKSAIQELFTDRGSRKGLIIKIIADVTYAFSGFMVIQSYAQEILQYTGSSINPAHSTMVMSGVQTLVGFPSSYLVDRWGRKATYLLSGIMSAICLMIVGFFFFFKFAKEIDVSSISWLPLVALTFLQIACNMGLSTIPYIYSGELFSVKVKGVAVMISSIFASFCVFLSKIMTPYLSNAAGLYTIFWLFSCVCVIGPFCILYVAPETKGKNLEEVLELLRSKKKRKISS